MTRFTTSALLITLAAGFGCESSHPHSDRLEVRAADVEAHPGWTETSRFIGGSKVWMAPKAAVDTSMISEARPAVDHHGNSVVVVRLTPDGALALSELTARQETRPLAVLIEGDVVATPDLTPPAANDGCVAGTSLSEYAASTVLPLVPAARVRSPVRSLPAPRASKHRGRCPNNFSCIHESSCAISSPRPCYALLRKV